MNRRRLAMNNKSLLDCRRNLAMVCGQVSVFGYFLASSPCPHSLLCLYFQEGNGCVSTSHSLCSSQGCHKITLQAEGFTHAGHYFHGFNLLPMYPGKADIYLILIVVLTVYSRKHCMLMEDICFQAAYANCSDIMETLI